MNSEKTACKLYDTGQFNGICRAYLILAMYILEDVACGLYHVDWAYWLTLERQDDKQRGVKHDV